MLPETESAVKYSQCFLDCMKSGLSVYSSVKGLCKKQNKTIRNAAEEMKERLEEGCSLSFCFQESTFIRFSAQYIAFIKAAEKSGNIVKSLEYIISDWKEKKRRQEKRIAECIYPLCIVLFSVAGSVLLMKYGETMISDFSGNFSIESFRKAAFKSFVEANGFLLICVIIFICLMRKNISAEEKINFFKVLQFLCETTNGLYESIETALMTVIKNKKLKVCALNAMWLLERGFSASEAFAEIQKCSGIDFEIMADENTAAENIRTINDFLENKRKRKEKILESLVEPGIIMVLTVYLMILMVNIVLPLMYSFQI